MNVPARTRWLRPLLLALALVAVAWGLRASFTERLFWNLDEGVTFAVAQQVLAGEVLYRDAVDHRGPLVPYLKAAALAVVGDWNFGVLHGWFAVGLGLFAFGLYRLATGLGDERTGVAAAVSFTVLAFTLPGPEDTMALHTEWIMEMFSLLGFLVFARLIVTPRLSGGMLTGVCFGLAALSKQPGLLDFAVVFALLILLLLSQPERRGALARFMAGSLLGVALMFGLAWAYFGLHGAAAEFRYYAWTYNTTLYVPEVPLLERLRSLTLPLEALGNNARLFLAVALLACLGLLGRAFRSLPAVLRREQTLPVLTWLILGWGAAGWISCGLSGRNFAHYVIHIVPATSLACGWLLARLSSPSHFVSLSLGLRRFLLAASVVFAGIDVTRIHQALVPGADPNAKTVREFASRFSAEHERWFVWGFYPEVYGWARRLPASRFSYSNFLTGLIPWTNVDLAVDTSYAVVPDAWNQLAADLGRKPPAVIVTSHARHYAKYPLLAQAWFRDWLPERYVEVTDPRIKSMGFRTFVQSDPIEAPDLPTDLPVDAGFRPEVRLEDPLLHDPIVRIETIAPAGSQSVSLAVGERLVRTVAVPAEDKTRIAFLVRLAELNQIGTDQVSLLIRSAAGLRRSRTVAVVGLFDLDRSGFPSEPRLGWDGQEIAPLAVTGEWRFVTRDGHSGWAAPRAASFTFPVPPAAQRLQWRWHGADPLHVRAQLEDGSFTELDLQTYPDERQAVELEPTSMRSVTLAVDGDGEAWIGELVADAIGPVLHLGSETLHPIHSEIGVQGRPTSDDKVRWFMHAPARVHYRLRPGLTGVIMRYGFIDDTWQRPPEHPTTGAEFRIEHLHPDGKTEVLFARAMNPVYVEHDRGLQEVEFPLIRRTSGELHFVIDEGPFDQRSGDWTFLQDGRLLGPGPDITVPDGPVLTPRSGTFGIGEIIDTRTPNGWWDAHAPSRLSYPFPETLGGVTIRFAFKPEAWQGRSAPQITDGIELVVERLSATGVLEELHRSAWNPAADSSHRGSLSVDVDLPEPAPGDSLLISTTNGPASEEDFDWTLWGPFTGRLRPAPATP